MHTELWEKALEYFKKVTSPLERAESEAYRFDAEDLTQAVVDAITVAQNWIRDGNRADLSKMGLTGWMSGQGQGILEHLDDNIYRAIQEAEAVGAGSIMSHLKKARGVLVDRAADILTAERRFVKKYRFERESSMSQSIKEQLVRLGAARPDLRNDIRPVLRTLEASFDRVAGGADAQVLFKNHGTFKGKVGRGNLEKAERMSKRDVAAYIAEAYETMEEPYPQVDYWMQYPKAVLDIAYADLKGG